jgi:TonB family protein
MRERSVIARATRLGRAALVVSLFSLAGPVMGSATAAAAPAEEVAVVTTPLGEIVWRFLGKDAPGHTAYVKELIRRGFYDGTTFHRVIPHFVVQGGDPLSKNDDRSDDGEGEGDRKLKAEFSTTLHYRPGTVGMARDADPDSGSCQFFIALESLPRLDGRYTIFGEVFAGLDVARKIAEVPRDLRDNPLAPVKVTVRLERREVPPAVLSLEPGESGEVLTGPTKPRPYDPKNALWKAPVFKAAQDESPFDFVDTPRPKLEIVTGADGGVLDVRFAAVDTPDAATIRERVLRWKLMPGAYDGKVLKTRFEVESDGTEISAPTSPGMPVEIGSDVGAPVAAPRVDLPQSAKAPEKGSKLRLTIDESGAVTEAALQSSCGDEALDAAAAQAARRMLFAPATRRYPGRKDPEPTPVYLDVEARFMAAPRP